MVEVKFQCPMCSTSLGGNGSDERAVLVCTNCQMTYVVREGIYYLTRYDKSWEAVHQEAVGTIECMKADGSYKEDPPESIDKYPFYEEKREQGTDVNRVMFEMCLELIGDRKGVVLELGAKNGWAINQFIRRGFEAVATDITDDDKVGLGYSRKLMRFTKRPFVRVLCDAAYIPLESDQFDVVFICSTLHHVREKEKALSEIYRVLKSGGVFVAMGENPRHPEKSIEDSLGPAYRETLLYHINETQPTMGEYYALLDEVGFSKYFIYPFDENFLKNGWHFGSDNMFKKLEGLPVRTVHRSMRSVVDTFSWRTKSMFDVKKVHVLNHWLYVPSNTVMWAEK